MHLDGPGASLNNEPIDVASMFELLGEIGDCLSAENPEEYLNQHYLLEQNSTLLKRAGQLAIMAAVVICAIYTSAPLAALLAERMSDIPRYFR